MKKRKLVIIGGGIQAITLATGLNHFDFRDTVIIDPLHSLGDNWQAATGKQNLADLRTPMFAHVDPWNTQAMLDYAQTELSMPEARIDDIARAKVFGCHLAHMIWQHNLAELHLKDSVLDIQQKDGQFVVHTQSGTQIEGTHVVVAVGIGKPCMPAGLPVSDRILHSASVDVRDTKWNGMSLCIIGSGLTAATLAIELSLRGANVCLCCRNSLTVSQAEADPLWIPGKPLHTTFLTIKDPGHRIQMTKAARVGRGITPAVWSKIWQMVDMGHISVCQHHNGLPQLATSIADGESHSFDTLICATGYECNLSMHPFLASLQALRPIECIDGLPILDTTYQSVSHSGLYFMGRLAEHQGGPLSRNIPGAQFGAQRIARAILKV